MLKNIGLIKDPNLKAWNKLLSKGSILLDALHFQNHRSKSNKNFILKMKNKKVILTSAAILGGIISLVSIYYLIKHKNLNRRISSHIHHWHPFSSNGHKKH